MGLNHEPGAGSGQPVGKGLPIRQGQHDTEMRHRHVMAIDRVQVRPLGPGRRQMGDDLMAEQVEIDPFGRTAPLGATSTPP